MIIEKNKKSILQAVILVVLFVLLDQITKHLASLYLKAGKVIELIPEVLELRYLENQSAAFSMDLLTLLDKIFHFQYFANNPDAFLFCKMLFLALFTIIVVIVLSVIFLRIPQENKRLRYLDWILIAFVAGAIGNCIDRVVNHYVIDFIYFRLINFPIFNVADIYVTLAAFGIILLGIFYYKEEDLEVIFPSKKDRT